MRARHRICSSVLIVSSLLAPAAFVSLLAAPAAQGAVPYIFESVEPPFVSGDIADANTILAQSFVATANYKLVWVQVYALDVGRADIARIEIYQDFGGTPGGGVLGIGQTQGSGAFAWLRADLSPQPLLITGNRYWIEFISFENSPNAYNWARSVSTNYTAGWSATYKGSAWSPQPTIDYLFETWGIRGPSITVGLTVDSTSAGAGDPLRYTVYFDNVGTTTAAIVWVNRSLSADLTYVSDDASANGGTATSQGWVFLGVDVGLHRFHIDVLTKYTVFEGLPITTSVHLIYSDGQTLQEESSASATTIARVPSLIIRSTASPAFVAPGDNLSYNVTLINVGSRPASRVWLNDSLPANVTYLSDSAASIAVFSGSWRSGNTIHYNFTDVPGGVYTFTINVTVNMGVRNGTWLVNWGYGNYTDGGGRTREPVTAFAVARVHGASIRIVQSTVLVVVQPREPVRFVIRFDNEGDATASRVWVNDTLPVGLTYASDNASVSPSFVNGTCAGPSCAWEFANVAPGPHAIALNTIVAAGLSDGTVLTNRASLEYTDTNGIPLEPSSSDRTVRVSRPSFSMGVTANQYANPGDTLGFFVRIDNQGSGVAPRGWLNLTLPAGVTYATDNASDSGGVRSGPASWVFRNLTAGRLSLFVAVLLAPGLADRTPLTSRFTFEHEDEHGNTGTPEAVSVTTTVTAPILGIQASASQASVPRGDSVTFTVLAVNSGSGIASDMWINDTIPEGTTFVRSSHQYISTSGSSFTWHLSDFGSGAVTLNITVRIESEVPAGRNLRDTFTVSYTDANGNFIASQEASVDVMVLESPLSPGLTLPITVLVLGILVAALVGFIGWKVYGVGSKDKPRIDELFLLHRSGELVRHLTRSLRPNVDSDALSGMLVAVQDFIKESFRFVQGSLEELKFGSHRIMLAHGKHLILAAVVGGGHTERLAPVLLSGLDRLEAGLGPALKDWNGMPSSLEGVDRCLAEILKGKPTNGKGTPPPRATRGAL